MKILFLKIHIKSNIFYKKTKLLNKQKKQKERGQALGPNKPSLAPDL